MDFEIIDFHTHPFKELNTDIYFYGNTYKTTKDTTKEIFTKLGISKICGSVTKWQPLNENESLSERLKTINDEALYLAEYYNGFYYPGCQIIPSLVEESKREIDRFKKLGYNLVGELIPYNKCGLGFKIDVNDELDEILNYAEKQGMVVNIHTMDPDSMDALLKRHKSLMFVAAHPGEPPQFMRHLERFKMCDNYHLDMSGTGMFRYGTLKMAVDRMGADRVLFGSDYPGCSPAMFLGGVLMEGLLSDSEKEYVLSKNAKRLLNIK